MRYVSYVLVGIICLSSLVVKGDEGMWIPLLLKELNESNMQESGLRLTAEDIYAVNKSSLKDAVVHFGGGCTGEIVSGSGLLFTNHHCGYSQIQSHSSVEKDYLTNGFWAMNRGEELPNPGLFVTFIISIEDVTSKVLKGVKAEDTEEKRSLLIAENIKTISAAAVGTSHYGAMIKPFFYGNEYYMFITETFNDVRLVGAPPSSIGKFGGDTDNWMWPRHTGDFSVFRVYADKDNKPAAYSENNVPYEPRHFFPVSLKDLYEGDFTMTYGFPGRTEQYLPSYAVEYIAQKANPMRINMREQSLSIIENTMRQSDELRIKYSAKHARISNAYKKWQGENRGINKLEAIDKKRKLEEYFQVMVNRSPDFKRKYGTLMEDFRKLYKEGERYDFARDLFIEIVYYGPEIIRFSNQFDNLVMNYARFSEEGKALEMAEKLKQSLAGHFKNYDVATDKELMTVMLAEYLGQIDAELGPKIGATIQSKYKGDYRKYVEAMFSKSIFANPEKLNQVLENFSSGAASKMKKDPAFVLMKDIFTAYNSNVTPQRDMLQSQVESKLRLYVQGLQDVIPNHLYWPDANSTLRLSYGKVRGSVPRDGMQYMANTTLDGIMEKYVPNDREFHLLPRMLDLYQKKEYGRYAQNGKLWVCFTGSNHTTGGNSGSPVLNADGHLIGINFDRSWESTMSDIIFDEKLCRNIIVDIRYVLWVIDKYAGAGYLLDEMELISSETALADRIRSLTDSIRQMPENAKLFTMRGEEYYALDMLTESLNDFNTALTYNPRDAGAYFARGRLFSRTMAFNKAVADFSTAVEINPQLKEGYYERGLIYAAIGRYGQGVEDFSRSVELDPLFHEAYRNRGMAFYKLGKTEASCSDFKMAYQLSGKKSALFYEDLCE